jgi:C1A family cysteine protease
VEDIKQAIMTYGSVAVGIKADSWLMAYSGGVFDHCTTGSANHCVALCGWDDRLGPSGAWLMKNSWGPDWGGVDIDESGTVDPDEGGFCWIIYDCNRVGDSAAYPIPYYGG